MENLTLVLISMLPIFVKGYDILSLVFEWAGSEATSREEHSGVSLRPAVCRHNINRGCLRVVQGNANDESQSEGPWQIYI